MLTARQQALLAYLLDVTKELVARGALRQASGQSLLDIFKSEPRIVLGAVGEDAAIVLRELGVGMAKSKLVNDLLGAAGSWLTDRMAEAIKGNGKRR